MYMSIRWLLFALESIPQDINVFNCNFRRVWGVFNLGNDDYIEVIE